MTHKIGLVEALCGFQFTLKHLDGRQIVVKYAAGKVIEPGKNCIFLQVLHVEDDTTACEY
jgi:DnaJ-class molecular chaperone